MLLIKSVENLDLTLSKLQSEGKKVGFVATMGALHPGHISLIERSQRENDITVCSIFVNPRQFNDASDLEKYPRPIEHDTLILSEAGTDILFLPEVDDIYPRLYNDPKIDLKGLDTILEGAMRPGHFIGVALVVKRLFDCIKPDKAYFGQKDFQQTLVIKELVKQFGLPVEIVVSDILRESNGLAMSSRNTRLTEDQRKYAGFIYEALVNLKLNVKKLSLKEAIDKAAFEILQHKDTQIEYLEIVNPETLAVLDTIDHSKAVALVVVNYCGVRLLDNIYI